MTKSDPVAKGEDGAYGASFAEIYDVITRHKSYDEEIGKLVGLLQERGRLQRGGRLLDLGCGTGTHAIRLSEEGFDVTGLDLSAEMIAIARSKDSDVRFHCADIADFPEEGFEAVVSLFNVINCLPSLEGLQRFLSEVRRRMVDGGYLLLEAWNAVAVMQEPPTRVERVYPFGEGEIRRTVTPRADFMNQRLVLTYDIEMDGGRSRSVEHPLVLFMPWEIRLALEAAGFADIEILTALPDLQSAGDQDRMLAFSCRAEGAPTDPELS